jgi:hypothetical protein
MLDEGKFRRQKRTSLPLIGELYLIENHRHNYGQYLTTPSRTHSNNHFASFYSLILNFLIAIPSLTMVLQTNTMICREISD